MPANSPIATNQPEEIALLIETLNGLEPLKPSEAESWGERVCNKASNGLLGIAVLLFLILCILAGARYFGWGSNSLQPIAVSLAVGSGVIALLALLCDTLGGLMVIVMFRRYSDRTRALECQRDFLHVGQLVDTSAILLRLADDWLALKHKLTEHRLALFFGGSEKLALLGLIGSAWTAWRQLSMDLLSLASSPLFWGVSFVTGLALGGMMSRIALSRIIYQRGLIQLALSIHPDAQLTAQKLSIHKGA